jgi:hypothetical protein
VQGDPKHSALLSVINVTFVDFTASTGNGQFYALEHCGKCKTFQGGATSFTSGLKFVQADGSKPRLSFWSWGHQGVFLDTDGSLLNADTLPAGLLPSGWSLGPGASWHSAVENDMFNPDECVYVRGSTAPGTSNDGALCSPALTFRRVMLNGHGPSVRCAADQPSKCLSSGAGAKAALVQDEPVCPRTHRMVWFRALVLSVCRPPSIRRASCPRTCW